MVEITVGLDPLDAYSILMQFAQNYGEGTLRLAMHAAVPQVFRPELLHLIRVNFLSKEPNQSDLYTSAPGNVGHIPLPDSTSEADILLSPLSENIGNGYFQWDSEIRRLLLDLLENTYPSSPLSRTEQVANFLIQYVQHSERSITSGQSHLWWNYLYMQEWVALSLVNPDSAAEQLAMALQHSSEANEVVGKVRLGGLASALSTSLFGYHDLLTYALGVQLIQAGREEEGRKLLETLGEKEINIGHVVLPAVSKFIEEHYKIKQKNTYPPILLSFANDSITVANRIKEELGKLGINVFLSTADGISWDDAVKFTRLLPAWSGKNITLPDEKDWEDAARGIKGGSYTYPWGNAWQTDTANVRRSSNVASFDASFDVAGNVWEWVSGQTIMTESSMIVVISPDYAASSRKLTELNIALSNCTTVLPVLAIDVENVPQELSNIFTFDLRDEARFEDMFAEIAAVLKKPFSHVGKLYNVPPMPQNYMPRLEETQVLKNQLLNSGESPVSVVAIQGLAGIGKTVTASALAHDCEIRRMFPDGIIWIQAAQLRDTDDLIRYLAEVYDLTPKPPYWENVKRILRDKKSLIIMDDVGDANFVHILIRETEQARILLTTRDNSVAEKFQSQGLQLEAMSQAEALTLLRQISGSDDPLLTEIANLAGNLPLALQWAAIQLRDFGAVEVLQRLRSGGQSDLLESLFESSLKQISSRERELFIALSAFSEDEGIPVNQVEELGKQITPDLSPLEIRRFLTNLEGLGLISFTNDGEAIRIHPITHNFLLRNLEKLRTERILQLDEDTSLDSTQPSIPTIIKTLQNRTGRSSNQVRELMTGYMGVKYSSATFARKFRRENANARYETDEMLALVRAFVDGIPDQARCRAEEAFRLFALARISIDDFKHLKPLFPDKEYARAWTQYTQPTIAGADIANEKEFDAFISYSAKNRDIADQIHSALIAAGFKIWYDQTKIHLGDDWAGVLQQGLESSKCIVLLMSPDSIRSDFIQREQDWAVTNGIPSIPVLVAGDFSDSMPEKLRSLSFVDLRSEQYQAGFQRLIDAITFYARWTETQRQAYINREHDVFLSYSRKDHDFVHRLQQTLQSNNLRVWIDTSIYGYDFALEIENAVKNSSCIITVLSPEAVQSEWVRREIEIAQANKIRIIPIMIRRCDLPLNLRTINYLDMSNDDYHLRSQQLIHAIREHIQQLQEDEILSGVRTRLEREIGRKLLQVGWNRPPFTLSMAQRVPGQSVVADFTLQHPDFGYLAVVTTIRSGGEVKQRKNIILNYGISLRARLGYIASSESILEVDLKDGSEREFQQFPEAQDILQRLSEETTRLESLFTSQALSQLYEFAQQMGFSPEKYKDNSLRFVVANENTHVELLIEQVDNYIVYSAPILTLSQFKGIDRNCITEFLLRHNMDVAPFSYLITQNRDEVRLQFNSFETNERDQNLRQFTSALSSLRQLAGTFEDLIEQISLECGSAERTTPTTKKTLLDDRVEKRATGRKSQPRGDTLELHIITSLKGGLGKTTIALALTQVFQGSHNSVAVIDFNTTNPDLFQVFRSSSQRQSEQIIRIDSPVTSNRDGIELKQLVDPIASVKIFAPNTYRIQTTEDFWNTVLAISTYEPLYTPSQIMIIDTNFHPANFAGAISDDFTEYLRTLEAQFRTVQIQMWFNWTWAAVEHPENLIESLQRLSRSVQKFNSVKLTMMHVLAPLQMVTPTSSLRNLMNSLLVGRSDTYIVQPLLKLAESNKIAHLIPFIDLYEILRKNLSNLDVNHEEDELIFESIVDDLLKKYRGRSPNIIAIPFYFQNFRIDSRDGQKLMESKQMHRLSDILKIQLL